MQFASWCGKSEARTEATQKIQSRVPSHLLEAMMILIVSWMFDRGRQAASVGEKSRICAVPSQVELRELNPS